jgi:predicted AlkP superfamily pyrophosphatase or phosphodiesterase
MHCNEPDEVKARLRWYDENLRKVFAAAREINPETVFAVTSDHGMTPVQKTFDLIHEVETLNLRMPKDYLAVYDSTMGRFWFFNDSARHAVVSRLQNLPCGRFLSDSEQQELGVLFADRRYGEAIFLLHPGWLISKSNFNGPAWRPIGMHGYHPDDSYSDGVFLVSQEPTICMNSVANVYDWIMNASGLNTVAGNPL